MCGSNVKTTIELQARLRAIDKISANVIKTEDAINYFGMPTDLAFELRIRVSDVRNWGEYVPQFYADLISKIIANDAVAN